MGMDKEEDVKEMEEIKAREDLIIAEDEEEEGDDDDDDDDDDVDIAVFMHFGHVEDEDDGMRRIWGRIHSWMTEKSPQMLELLTPGATEAQILILEEKLGIARLPLDFRASYRIHNGSTAVFYFGIDGPKSYFSLDQIFAAWNAMQQNFSQHVSLDYPRTHLDHKEVHAKLWSNGWIPFGANEQEDLLCVDLLPTVFGDYGQVIEWSKTHDHTRLQEHSFLRYIEQFADQLEAGNYSLSTDGTCLIYSASEPV